MSDVGIDRLTRRITNLGRFLDCMDNEERRIAKATIKCLRRTRDDLITTKAEGINCGR